MDLEKIAAGFRIVIEGLGEDPEREGLKATPERVARAYQELLANVGKEPEGLLDTQFSEPCDEMVLLKNIPFISMCEHHFLPFIGKAHVAYIPKNKIVGLSKLARVVDFYARRPQIQERMTRQIADYIQQALKPLGVAVVLESSHSCMTMRGIKKPGSVMMTSQLLGAFKNNPKTRGEFMSLIRQ
ncbi:MAG TPA: GTP cyclohydrolase I FolE [Fibrobacteraceae bacterium]|nr:GTP cyclohydrolase I FolE [Fibrobacteraceae bacterium]